MPCVLRRLALLSLASRVSQQTNPCSPSPPRLPQVTAVPYDTPIPGFQTSNTINLRLWAAKPDREFDLQAFNTGDYVQVITFF